MKEETKKFRYGEVVRHKETGYECLIRDNNVMPINICEDIGNGMGNSVKFYTIDELEKKFDKIINPNVFEWKESPPRKDRLIADLQALQSDKDYERAHYLADELLLAYIGYKEVTEAFNKINKY